MFPGPITFEEPLRAVACRGQADVFFLFYYLPQNGNIIILKTAIFLKSVISAFYDAGFSVTAFSSFVFNAFLKLL